MLLAIIAKSSGWSGCHRAEQIDLVNAVPGTKRAMRWIRHAGLLGRAEGARLSAGPFGRARACVRGYAAMGPPRTSFGYTARATASS